MHSPVRTTLRALVAVVLVTLAAAWPVHAHAGWRGLEALALAAGVSLLGALAGRVPHRLVRQGPYALVNASLAGLGVRLLVTLALALALFLATSLPRVPLAVGLVLSYFALLAVEVHELVVRARTPAADHASPRPVSPSPGKGAPSR